MKKHISKLKTYFPFIAISALAVIIGISFVANRWFMPTTSAQTIAADLKKLYTIFQRIDHDCKILGFDSDKVAINFLTIKKGGFVGSEVGSMMLAHPEKWNGPYLDHNLHAQGKEYQVVTTRAGYFIVPGDGVVLPHKKVIGKDLHLTATSDIAAGIKTEGNLLHKGTPLAIPLPIGARCISAEQVIFAENDELA